MGGGGDSTSTQEQESYNYDEDVVVEGGSIGVGKDGIYYAAEFTMPEAVGEADLVSGGQGNTAVSGSTIIGDIGIGSSVIVTDMPEETRSLLDQAMTMVSANANNFMAFVQGRDAESEIFDDSEVTDDSAINVSTGLTLSDISEFFATPAGIGLGVGVVAVGGVLGWHLYKKNEGK